MKLILTTREEANIGLISFLESFSTRFFEDKVPIIQKIDRKLKMARDKDGKLEIKSEKGQEVDKDTKDLFAKFFYELEVI